MVFRGMFSFKKKSPFMFNNLIMTNENYGDFLKFEEGCCFSFALYNMQHFY